MDAGEGGGSGRRRRREAALELARVAVAAVAPEELPLLEANGAARPRGSGRSEDELLDFGLDTSVVVVSVAALSAAQAVVAQPGYGLHQGY